MSTRLATSAVTTALTLSALSFLLSGCGPGPLSSAAPRPTVSATVSSAAAPSGSPSASTSPPRASRKPTAQKPTAQKRGAADLNRALLGVREVPSGFAVSDSSSGTVGAEVSSYRRSCAALVRLLNTDRVPGSRTEADVAYAGTKTGAALQQSVDALGSKAAARATVESYRTALRGCGEVSLSMGLAGTTPVLVEPLSFRGVERTQAARFTVTQGPLAGFQLIRSVSQAEDLVVGATYLGVHTADAEAITAKAVRKVETTLGEASRA